MIVNKNKTYQYTGESLVVLKITDLIASSYFDESNIKLPDGIHLVGPHFYKHSKRDIIIGAQYFCIS